MKNVYELSDYGVYSAYWDRKMHYGSASEDWTRFRKAIEREPLYIGDGNGGHFKFRACTGGKFRVYHMR